MTAACFTATEKKLDPKPFYWALIVVALLLAVWQALAYVGHQRSNNTALWQRWYPVTMSSQPQTAIPVGGQYDRGPNNNIVQTEAGLYFLTGDTFVPAAGDKVVVQANQRWDMYLCDLPGQRCISIHSFCAEAKWPEIARDAQGRIEGCYAPYLGSGATSAPVAAITTPPADRSGRKGGRGKMLPAVGISHPSEWAWRMGLPKSSPSPQTAYTPH